MPKLLLAEDERSLNKAMRLFLQTFEGLYVESVFDGVEAMAAIEKDPPDLIVLDVNMPHKNGYEVADEILANDNLKDVKILFLTNLCANFARKDLIKHKNITLVCKAETSMVDVRKLISKLLNI